MPKFLLHTCCAPCSIAVIDELKNQFGLTAFFYNPNIFPEDEYLKRKTEVKKICDEWGVKMADMDYEAAKWREAIKGFENEPEGGVRCCSCFKFRLARAAEYAKKNGFLWWGTTLTSGRNKKAEIIHPICKAFSKHYNLRFYEEDWKKKGRQEKAAKMVKEKGIYRQDYCGCEHSLKSKYED
ncbi:MAG: epoxyqueuosine reductase QueH [Patescibacteria group bacterium]